MGFSRSLKAKLNVFQTVRRVFLFTLGFGGKPLYLMCFGAIKNIDLQRHYHTKIRVRLKGK
jgi:hypothetical protein